MENSAVTHTYWIKSYIKVLDDPKLAKLPNHLWRRMFEFEMMAGEFGKNGLLQPVHDMAWRLRTDESQLAEQLEALAQVGVVAANAAGEWFLPGFAERQGPSPVKERVNAYRKRKAAERERVLRNVTPDNRTESETEGEEKVIKGGGGDLPELTPPAIAPPPPTPSWQPDILTQRAERIFRATTQMLMFPSTDKRDQAIRVCLAYFDREGDEEKAVKALRPYWLAWRKYRTKAGSQASSTNLAWLTDWAATGEIPPVAQVGHKKDGGDLIWAEVHR